MRSVAEVGRHAEVMIETDLAWPGRKGFAPIGHVAAGHAEMPLTERCRSIALTFAKRCERQAIGLDVQWRIGRQYLAVLDGRAPIVTAGHQPVTRRRTNRAGSIGLGEPSPLSRKPIHVWRLHPLRAITPCAAPTVIVSKNENNVWLERLLRSSHRDCNQSESKP